MLVAIGVAATSVVVVTSFIIITYVKFKISVQQAGIAALAKPS
jgi:hypothetical protein